MATPHDDFLAHRYVNIPCPNGKHPRSIVTFRDDAVAVMFCIPCEQVWTELTSHPEIHAMKIDVTMRP
jgi:hypothetical protein